jgi:Aldehyde dehydrogenase family
VGDPLDRATKIGPLARRDLRDGLHRQVQETLIQGARLELGGEPRESCGYFYHPTIVSGVTPDMPMFRQETFGPAAAVIRVRDAEEALALANASQYGLGSSAWTRNLDRARELVARIQAGAVFINGIVASDPRLPAGGVKHYRDIEELMVERGVVLTYETVRHWCLKFGQTHANELRRRRPRCGDKWHLHRHSQPCRKCKNTVCPESTKYRSTNYR